MMILFWQVFSLLDFFLLHQKKIISPLTMNEMILILLLLQTKEPGTIVLYNYKFFCQDSVGIMNVMVS
jgi:hypothetical protein